MPKKIPKLLASDAKDQISDWIRTSFPLTKEETIKGADHYRQEKQNAIGLIALLAILINIVMIYLMVLLVVERPLKRLTQSLEKINQGKTVLIPFQKRKSTPTPFGLRVLTPENTFLLTMNSFTQ